MEAFHWDFFFFFTKLVQITGDYPESSYHRDQLNQHWMENIKVYPSEQTSMKFKHKIIYIYNYPHSTKILENVVCKKCHRHADIAGNIVPECPTYGPALVYAMTSFYRSSLMHVCVTRAQSGNVSTSHDIQCFSRNAAPHFSSSMLIMVRPGQIGITRVKIKEPKTLNDNTCVGKCSINCL